MPSKTLTPRNTLGPIDLDRPLLDHPLNVGRVLWLYGGSGAAVGGGRWPDLCGKNHGTLASGPTWAPTGRSDIGLQLSGTGVTLGTDAIFSFASFTYVAWVRWSVASGDVVNVGDRSTFGLRAPGGGFPNGQIGHEYYNGSAFVGLSSGVSPTTSQWYRVGVSFAASGTRRISVNGVVLASDSVTSAVYAGTRTADVGISYAGSGGLSGDIGDVGISTRAWSAADLAADYDLSRRGYHGVLRRHSRRTWFVGTSPAPSGAFVPLLSGLGW